MLAFARAIAKDTSIYIFDEPTSNIDVKNEQTIKNIISEVLKDSTVIIIAHRPTTIENVDKILKVQNKKVVVKSRKLLFIWTIWKSLLKLLKKLTTNEEQKGKCIQLNYRA